MKYKINLGGKEIVEIDENKRQEWESHNITKHDQDVCMWAGQMRGSCYFGISLNDEKGLHEIPRFARITKKAFIKILNWNLDWRCIIDCDIILAKNKAKHSWDGKNWVNHPEKIKVLSPR